MVGGQWPQLGYAPPPSERSLAAGKEVVLSDALVCFSPDVPTDERQAARLFLDNLARVYPHLAQTETQWHDWPQKARESARDLARTPKAAWSSGTATPTPGPIWTLRSRTAWYSLLF